MFQRVCCCLGPDHVLGYLLVSYSPQEFERLNNVRALKSEEMRRFQQNVALDHVRVQNLLNDLEYLVRHPRALDSGELLDWRIICFNSLSDIFVELVFFLIQ